MLTAAWHIEFIKLSANGVTAFEGSVIFQDPRELDGFDVGLAASRIAGSINVTRACSKPIRDSAAAPRSLPRERVQAAGIDACMADVPRDPDAHRPGAGVARSSIKGFWGRKGADHDGRGAMKANDEVPAPQGKLTLGFTAQRQPSRANLVAAETQRWSKSRHNLRNLGNVGSKCADFGTRDPRTRSVR